MNSIDNGKFWEKRAVLYNNLDWAKSDQYLKAFIEAGEFKKTDVVLDVGTGTGIVAHNVSPYVKEVIGLDISQAMLEHCNWRGNMYFIKRDIRDPFFHDGVFDKVTARQVFHHITENTQNAMDECYRVLKKGGKMVLSDGVPPSRMVKKDYIEIFKLKENRLTFMEEDLVALMEDAGFDNIKLKTLRLRQMSVKNWLNNSGLPEATKNKIFYMHINAGDYFKKAYNMSIFDGDCFIDMKMAILTGIK